jgi:phosphomannomutase
VTESIARARAWIASDPDPATRAELQHLLDIGDDAEVRSRMTESLTFGTAGIRAPVGAGPDRMNRAVVIRTTGGLAEFLIERAGGVPANPVVVGFDARPTSKQFAEDTVGVLAAAGFRVVYFPDVTPTPVVAFAAKHLDAVAAVVVTASHNPPADNGYKVYDSNAAQIVSPVDVAIASAIEHQPGARDIPRIPEAFTSDSPLLTMAGEEILDAYWSEVDASRPEPSPSDLRIVYTPIHGVGGQVIDLVFQRGGHTGLMTVPEQAVPDGSFPTVAFPNPEEPGALDLASALARAEDADLILANDPDADRLAVVVKDEDDWVALTGNEIGVLLGDYVLRHHAGDTRPIVLNSIVSSPMLGVLASRYDAHHEPTLTGFKWIVNAGLALETQGVGAFVYGYEEALGYTIGSTVRDKDGISAALVFADLVAGLAADGLSVHARLSELWRECGLWVSAQRSIVRVGPEGQDAIRQAVVQLAESPPSSVDGYEVTHVIDYRVGFESRPAWLGRQELVELGLGELGRVLVRPSGTEPKLKIYVDLRSVAGVDPRAEHDILRRTAADLAGSVARMLPD